MASIYYATTTVTTVGYGAILSALLCPPLHYADCMSGAAPLLDADECTLQHFVELQLNGISDGTDHLPHWRCLPPFARGALFAPFLT